VSEAARDVEQVLVVPRDRAFPDGPFRGLRAAESTWLEELIAAHGAYRPRPEMEGDPAFKQVIPYLVLRDREAWFLMQRTRAGADRRLHDRWSIGVGGHVHPGDGGLTGGLEREWREELEADFVPGFRFVGLLNDDESDVGSVHLGAVFLADAGGRPVAVRETDKLSGRFASTDAVTAVHERLETWSALAFDALRAMALI
jgi:predicted NUDIX family phosphoesterase